MKHTLAAIILLASLGCAHTTPLRVPPASGYFGVRQLHTPVLCVTDADMTPERCKAVVEAHIAEINKAAGVEILHYAGTIEINDPAGMPDKDENIILMGIDALPETTQGITAPQAFNGPYLALTIIVLSEDAWTIGRQYDVALHELLHAVGIAHSDPRGMFPSLMNPAIGAQHGLSAADIATIKAAYGK